MSRRFSLTKTRTLKLTLIAFSIAQFLFSQFAEQLIHAQNIFPLYTWRIFHTVPNRYLSLDLVFIRSLDGQKYDPPRALMEMQDLFPNINFYTITVKIFDVGREYQATKNLNGIEHLNQLLIQGHTHVEWELRHVEFEVIEYFESGKTLAQNVLGEFHANR